MIWIQKIKDFPHISTARKIKYSQISYEFLFFLSSVKALRNSEKFQGFSNKFLDIFRAIFFPGEYVSFNRTENKNSNEN